MKIIAIQKQINTNKPPVVDTTKPVLIQTDKIVTDNAAIKSGQPLMVKEGIVYLSKNTLESSFGIQIRLFPKHLRNTLQKLTAFWLRSTQKKIS